MQPVIFGEFIAHDFVIKDDIIGYFSIGEYQGYRIVPRLLTLWRVDSYFREFLQLHYIHIRRWTCYHIEYIVSFSIRDHLVGNTSNDAFILELLANA